MFRKLTERLDTILETGVPGFDYIVYYKGECLYRHSNGYSDVENKIPVTGKELYNIYSCSKVITCTAALMLYEKGLFKLEDRLSEYMPEFKEMYVKGENGLKKAEKAITIKDLFCMTAGFSYDLNSPMLKLCKKETNGKCPERETMKYLAKEPLLFEPGERWEYSLCHDVLAVLVEVISGMRFNEYVEENIFKPLGMENSTFSITDAVINKVCPQYIFNNDTKKAEECSKNVEYRLGTEYECGGAGCISTVEDYIKFLEGLRTEKLIKADTLDLMTTNYISDEQRGDYWIDNYGYGLGVRCSMGNDNITEFGWGGANGTHLSVDRENEITVFYAQHLLNYPANNVLEEAAAIIKEILQI